MRCRSWSRGLPLAPPVDGHGLAAAAGPATATGRRVAAPGGAFARQLRAVFELLPFGRYLLNSLAVVALAVPLTIVSASLAGFAMAGLDRRSGRPRGRSRWRLLLVPVTATLADPFPALRWVGLTDSLLALVCRRSPGLAPLFVLIYYWAFRRVSTPRSSRWLISTALVRLTAWRRIGLPSGAGRRPRWRWRCLPSSSIGTTSSARCSTCVTRTSTRCRWACGSCSSSIPPAGQC